MPSVGDMQSARRSEPAYSLDDRAMLEAWLEFHRTTLELKCEGLDDAGRKARPVATSNLSLHGLVRHMAEVERNWFQRVLLSAPDTPPIYGPEDDIELVPLDDADFDTDLATFRGECERSREIARERELTDSGVRRDGEVVPLRWIYVHMIEEYARHNGHADLIRELVDGSVGW